MTPKQVYLLEKHSRNRRAKFETDFRSFCFYYFPHYFKLQPSLLHEDLFSDLESAIQNGVSDKLVRAAPRGGAKTTITSLSLVIWCALYQKKHYIILVSDTVDQAQDFLGNIRTEFEDNERIREDFGTVEGEIWTQTDIITAQDVRIQALGAGKKIRGRRYKQYRPDLIICDDLENDENIASVDQRNKMEEWFSKALSNAGDERTDIVVIGTVMHTDSLLSKIIRNPTYHSKIYKAILNWSNSKLWDEWERIVSNLDDQDRLLHGRDFFDTNKDVMLKGTKVLWPAREDYYTLMLARVAVGPAAFSSEKQNEPLSREDQRFLPEWIRFYDDEEILGQELFVVGWCDPSLGKKAGDYSAIITLGQNTNGVCYVLDADILRRRPDAIIMDVIYKHDQYNFTKFGVEENQFQEFFKDELMKKAQEMDRSINIKGVRQHSDKLLRIESLQPDIKNGRIRFKRDQSLLLQQLYNFPLADHDDGPDALEGAMSLLQKRTAVAQYFKESVQNEQNPGAVFSIKKQITTRNFTAFY